MIYHALPIGLTIVVIYLLTLFLSSTTFISKQAHRRFWNWVLLATFLITALIGLFMALKITYKWNIPFSEPLLHWHVEVGISMAFIAISHLTWHLNYYFGRNRPDDKEHTHRTEPGADRYASTAGMLLMLTGFSSSSSQFILIREAAILGGGTEASTGIFLWLWLIIAAAGAVAGGRSGTTGLRKMMWTLLGGMTLAPLLFILMNTVLLHPGEAPTVLKTLVILSVGVAPATFIASFVFIRLSAVRQDSGGFIPGSSFGMETAGSVAAGILTTITVSLHISNYQLYLLVILASVVITVLLLGYTVRLRRAVWISALPLAAIILIFSPDALVRSILLKGVKAEKSIDTPFGNITTGTYGGEQTIFYDHRPLFFIGDVIRAEENIHYALLQRDSYDTVMVISGGLMKHIDQLKKYRIGEVLYLEHDPDIIAAEGARDTTVGKMNIRVIDSDPLAFLRKSRTTFDAVLQLIPPPSSLSVNRFYTVEYFRMVKMHLSPGGIFMCTPMLFYNYSPESYCRGFSPVYNALIKVFKHVILIPGSSLYAVSSDLPLSDSISVMVARRSIENTYVNSDYIDDNEIRSKSEQILSRIDSSAAINTAVRPVTSLFTNILSLESIGIKGGMIAVLTLLVIIPFIFIRRGGFIMFASSAGLSGFGMIMIFILQMTVGNIYVLTALVLTVLMAGLAAGAARGSGSLMRHIIISPLLLTLIYGLTGIFASPLVTATPAFILPLIFITLLLAGFLTGSVYRMLTMPGGQRTTGGVYASDLAGSALGYLTVSTLLVPLLGIGNVCFIVAALILIAGIIATLTIKH
jgi:hypothetical protein